MEVLWIPNGSLKASKHISQPFLTLKVTSLKDPCCPAGIEIEIIQIHVFSHLAFVGTCIWDHVH